MTAQQIIEQALNIMQYGTDQADEFFPSFRIYLDFAARDIASDAQLYTTEDVDLVDGSFNVAILQKTCSRVMRVTQDGRELYTVVGDSFGDIKVQGAKEEPVRVKYLYVPRPIVELFDKPDVPEQFFPIIANYIVACHKGNGNPNTQGEASLYFQLYQTDKRNLIRFLRGTTESFELKNYL